MFMPNKVIKVILMGKKPGAARALLYLLEKGITVPLAVAQKDETYGNNLYKTATEHGVKVVSDKELNELIKNNHPTVQDIDLVISYLFWNRIKKSLIDLGRLGCVNFHPAPLPDYKGRAGYNTAILDERAEFGVSAHYIDSEDFDSGPIIKVLKFAIDSKLETAFSLERTTQIKLYELFEQVMGLFIQGAEIATTPNQGGTYLTGEELEKLKMVDLEKDPPAVIDRKIRAFFFPPYAGAKVNAQGKEYTLINDKIFELIFRELNK